MLFFLLLMRGFGLVVSSYQASMNALPIPKIEAEIAGELVYALGYLLTFMLPVVVLKRRLQKQGIPYRPRKADVGISGNLPVLVLGGTCLIWVQSYLNSAMVSVFHYAEFSEQVLWDTASARDGYQIVLQFIVIALVPAFCEEFLFRGVIYGNLRPFGKTQAILISSILFALMHQNIQQFFYTFVGGIAMALMYELTGNIWCGVIFHMFNNELAVLTEALYNGKYGEAVAPLLLLWDALVLILGSISIILLILYYRRKAIEARESGEKDPSVFGRHDHTDVDVYDQPVDRNTLIRGLKAPGMLVFAIAAVGSAVATYFAILFGVLEAFL